MCSQELTATGGSWVDVLTARHFSSQCGRTKVSNTCVQVLFFTRKLGSVHDRQATVIFGVTAMKR